MYLWSDAWYDFVWCSYIDQVETQAIWFLCWICCVSTKQKWCIQMDVNHLWQNHWFSFKNSLCVSSTSALRDALLLFHICEEDNSGLQTGLYPTEDEQDDSIK